MITDFLNALYHKYIMLPTNFVSEREGELHIYPCPFSAKTLQAILEDTEFIVTERHSIITVTR